jgi:hypothetical protein
VNDLTLRTISMTEYGEWFARNNGDLHHRSPYHEPSWLNATARSVKFVPVVIGIYDGRELTAAVPGQVTRRGPFRLFGSPLRGTMTSYLGPISLDHRLVHDGLPELLLRCQEHVRKQWHASYARITMRNEPEPLPDLGDSWRAQRAPSYRLDLTRGREAVWAALKSDCRRNIRRAEREEIEIAPFADPGLYYRMLHATFDRHGAKSFQTERFFHALIADVPSPVPLQALAATRHGEVIAAGLFLHDCAEVHFVSGASFPDNGSLPTSYLLHWHAITTAIDRGCHVFNSDASRVRSIDQFKESFRPELQKRCSLIWTPPHVRRAERMFMSSRKRRRQRRARRSQRSATTAP